MEVSKTNDHCSAALGFKSSMTSGFVVVNPLRDVKVTSTPEVLYCPLEMLTVAVPPDGELHAVSRVDPERGPQPAVPVTASAWATGANAKKTIKLTRVMRICMVASVKKARERQ